MNNAELNHKCDENDAPTIFSQLNKYDPEKVGNEKWLEHSRWIKFEEVVESTGEHWSKPHVGLLNFGSIKSVRKIFKNAIISFDHPGKNLQDILENILMIAIEKEKITINNKSFIIKILQMGHQKPKAKMKLSPINSLVSLSLLDTPNMKKTLGINRNTSVENFFSSGESLLSEKFDSKFRKKIPLRSEVANILVAELPFLNTSLGFFMRLKESLVIRNYTEVEIPTRFIVILFGNPGSHKSLVECGRVIGSLFVDNVFRNTIYTASSLKQIVDGINEFLHSAYVISPSALDSSVRIEPPKEKIPCRQNTIQLLKSQESHNIIYEDDDDIDLERTHRLFGGLIDDIKRKSKFYLSDFTDALHIQCFSTYAFLYFACLVPIITFGGLLMTATDGYLGAMESVLSGAIVGMIYALFSGQPLTILSSTGPVLVFESIMFRLCTSLDWDFLSLRLWIGIWLMVYLLIIVAFDLSVLVKYITKFTEECFAILIALIFIVESFKNIFDLLDDYPFNRNWNPNYVLNRTCKCIPPNSSILEKHNDAHTQRLLKFETPPLLPAYKSDLNHSLLFYIDWDSISNGYFSWKTHDFKLMCVHYGGYWEGNTCGKLYVSDIFFFSWLLMLGTFGVAFGLKLFKSSRIFPNIIRQTISNFSVVIAILIFTLLDFSIGLQTPKLTVPDKLEPTLGYSTRSWIVPIIGRNPWWSILVATIPALLAVILIFLDQQITTVIINRKKNKLKKGHGYHLDLFVVAILIGINSIMGVPWFVAGTVLSMNHVMSLKKESVNNAPGEPPIFLGCREQRVTHFMIFFTVGMSIFITPVLQRIPMPVLYGVFLYMGISPLGEIELVQRIGLFFMSAKNRPDLKYLRIIPIRRVHLFTIIQILSLAALWTIKSVKALSIGFPLMVLAICFIRKLLEYFFKVEELKRLDQLLPGTKAEKKLINCCSCFGNKENETEMLTPLYSQKIPTIVIEH